MDNIIKKQIGYLIAGIWAAWGLAILAILLDLAPSPLWIGAIEGTWYAIDAFMIFFIHYYFNIELQTPEQRFKELITELTDLIPVLNPEQAQLAEALQKKLVVS